MKTRYSKQIEQNVRHATRLAALIRDSPELELLAPVATNVVCFRYCGADAPIEALDDLNREIVMALHERGIAVPSYAMLRGRFAIRVAITNHRSRWDDFDQFTKSVLDLGRELRERPR